MKQYLIRLLSSEDHDVSRNKLIEIIKSTGTDRYDPQRKQISDDHYGEFNVDFFAEYDVDESTLEVKLLEAVEKFPARTKGDRGKSVIPDIAVLYDASKCEMIDGVYEYKKGSDCFRFTTDPVEALVEVRKL